MLIAANLGDSRAVVCSGNKAVNLTVDHKANNSREAKLVKARGGRVVRDMGCCRVDGILAVTRAMGDVELKPHVGDGESASFAV